MRSNDQQRSRDIGLIPFPHERPGYAANGSRFAGYLDAGVDEVLF